MSQPAFDFGADPLDDPSSPTYTVGELASGINDQLRRGFGDGVWVRGEIDGLRNAGPHTYFTLVEQSADGRAVLNVSFFAPAKRNLTPLLKRSRLELANGLAVRIFGHLDYYAPNGRLGLKMSGIDPRFTLGELAQQREQVVRRLVATGLYDANRSLPSPVVPLRVGVVTSLGSAAWHDFSDEIRRSGIGFELLVCDTRVQGAGAEHGLAAAVTSVARHDVDVVVVIRGGGARSELATFDAEPIAVAIARSPVPVFTGLGHETDRSVADEVAQRSLKTPTACARALVDAVAGVHQSAEQRWAAIATAAASSLTYERRELTGRAHRVAARTHAAVARSDERLAARCIRLATAGDQTVRAAGDGIERAVAALSARARRTVELNDRALAERAARVDLLDPVNLLRRGWSITRAADGSVVRSAADVAPGDTITTQIADGQITSRIEES